MTEWKSKIGTVSGVISSKEQELKELECFFFSFDSACDSGAYDPVKTRLMELQAETDKQSIASSQAVQVLPFCLEIPLNGLAWYHKWS